MPAHQGKFDGLCGPYAIVNAFERAGIRGRGEELFKIACGAPSRARWPDLLWDGTRFGDLQKMVKKCLASDENHIGLTASYPFKRRIPATNDEYWSRFDEVFDDPGVRCGIIGITMPDDHWIVVSWARGRLQFTDSTAGKLKLQKNRASLFAGERRQKPGQWLIDREEFVVLKRPMAG